MTEDERRDADEDQPAERARPRIVDKRGRRAEPPPVIGAPAAGSGGGTAPPPPHPAVEDEARALADELRRIPAHNWVVNVAVSLGNVAGVKLEAGATDEARLAIDGLAGLLDAVANRLGDAEMPLRQLLADLRLAFARALGD